MTWKLKVWMLMAPEGSGGAPAGGAPAGGAPAGGAPAGGAPAGGAPAGGAPAGGAPAGGGAEKPWYGDPGRKGLVENKGFREIGDVFTWGENLEKLVGRDKLVLPKDSTDADGWSKVFDALGRPKDAKEYQLPVPDGMDRGFADKFAAKFHARGLNVDQARGLAADWNEMVTEMANADNAAFKTKSAADVKGIWKDKGQDEGKKFFGQVNLAARAFGLQQPEVQKLEKALGTRRMFDLLHSMGEGLSEDDLDGDGQGGGAMTPAAAQAKVKELQGDAAWRKKFQDGDVGARAEMDRLNRIIAGM